MKVMIVRGNHQMFEFETVGRRCLWRHRVNGDKSLQYMVHYTVKKLIHRDEHYLCDRSLSELQTIGIFAASKTSFSSRHRHQLKEGQNTINNIIDLND